MARKRVIRPEERELWRKVARSVTPLNEARRQSLDDPAPPDPVTPKPAPKTGKSGKAASRPRPEPLEPPARPRPAPGPADRSAEKRVRRGRLGIDARIDLHGLTQAQALSSLRHFIAMAHAEGYRTVLVITGKGFKPRTRESEPWEQVEEPGVLRRRLPDWLAQPDLAAKVSGFAPAHIRHGGSGAFYVTLRTRT